VGTGSEYWNPGFSIGGNAFYPVAPSLAVGGRIAYNRWTPDEEALTAPFAGYGIDWDISGSASIVEFVPAIRIAPPTPPNQSINFFGQFGFGLFQMNFTARVRGTYAGQTVETFSEDSEMKTGFSLGGGITVGGGKRLGFEILPLYHIILTEGESTKYFSVAVGVVFGQ